MEISPAELPQAIEREFALLRRYETEQYQHTLTTVGQAIAITILAFGIPGIIYLTRALFSFQGHFRPAAFVTGLGLGLALGALLVLLQWRLWRRSRGTQSEATLRRLSPKSTALSTCLVLGIPFLTGSLGPACLFRRIRPLNPMESGHGSERSDAGAFLS